MSIRRCLGIASLAAAAASVAVVPSAVAQEPAPAATELTYGATSTGRALALSVFGQELTVGSTLTSLSSAVEALASGSGLATSLFQGGVTAAEVEADGTDGSTEETCDAVVDQVPGLSIGLACSSSLASIQSGVPTSLATGRVSEIVVNPVSAILGTPLSEVVAPVDDAVGQLLDGLRPVTTAVDDATGLGLEDTLDDLFGALFAGADLVTIDLGPAVARSEVVAGERISSSCATEGARIDVLDLPAVAGVDPAPVISVLVGDANTAVDVSSTDGAATPTASPALVRVIVPSLGLDVPVDLGQTIEIPLPEPLGTSVIQVADGSTGVDADGNTFATANGVLLDLLNGEALMGGVELALANCSSVAGAVVQQIPTTTAPPTTVPAAPQLPRTGGGAPHGAALAAAVGFAGLGLALLRRTVPTAG